MKKLIVCLLAITCAVNAKAQTPEPAKKTAEPVDIMHGINAGVASNTYLYEYYNYDNYGGNGSALPIAPALGYYLDIHMRGRTWLFTQFNLEWQNTKGTSQSYNPNNPYTTTRVSNYVDLYIPIRFAFRLGKEDAKFTFFPTAGFGLYMPVFYSYKSRYTGAQNYTYKDAAWFSSDDGVPFYPLLNIGFEAKWKFSQKHNLAIGFNSDYLVAHNTIYLKFGWNKYKKEKK